MPVFTLSAKLDPERYSYNESGGMVVTEAAVQKAVFLMGLSPKHKGFYYISMAIREHIGEGDMGVPCPCGTEEGLVKKRMERCMRYAIRYAWDVSDGEIHRLFPNSRIPPSPCEFISVMRWELCEGEDPPSGAGKHK